MRGIALALVVLAAAGCSPLPAGEGEDDFRVPLICGPKRERLPCGTGVEQGVAYRFNLPTHCGIEWAYFDGRYWVPRPKLDPPSHWASIESGMIVLVRRDRALFEADAGGGARFTPAPAPYRPDACA